MRRHASKHFLCLLPANRLANVMFSVSVCPLVILSTERRVPAPSPPAPVHGPGTTSQDVFELVQVGLHWSREPPSPFPPILTVQTFSNFFIMKHVWSASLWLESYWNCFLVKYGTFSHWLVYLSLVHLRRL